MPVVIRQGPEGGAYLAAAASSWARERAASADRLMAIAMQQRAREAEAWAEMGSGIVQTVNNLGQLMLQHKQSGLEREWRQAELDNQRKFQLEVLGIQQENREAMAEAELDNQLKLQAIRGGLRQGQLKTTYDPATGEFGFEETSLLDRTLGLGGGQYRRGGGLLGGMLDPKKQQQAQELQQAWAGAQHIAEHMGGSVPPGEPEQLYRLSMDAGIPPSEVMGRNPGATQTPGGFRKTLQSIVFERASANEMIDAFGRSLDKLAPETASNLFGIISQADKLEEEFPQGGQKQQGFADAISNLVKKGVRAINRDPAGQEVVSTELRAIRSLGEAAEQQRRGEEYRDERDYALRERRAKLDVIKEVVGMLAQTTVPTGELDAQEEPIMRFLTPAEMLSRAGEIVPILDHIVPSAEGGGQWMQVRLHDGTIRYVTKEQYAKLIQSPNTQAE